jgi:hypothetical protein
MAYEKKPVSLGDYRPTEDTTENDLLKLTLENGQVLFVHHRGFRQYNFTLEPIWVIHEDFCPSSIQVLRRPGMDYRKDIKGQPFDVPLEINATVGEQVMISIWPRMDEQSSAKLVSIQPCAYQDAYHDDLELAVSVHA